MSDPLTTAARIIVAAEHVPMTERDAFLRARVVAVESDRIELQVDEHLHYAILPSGLVWRLTRRDGRLTGALFRGGRNVDGERLGREGDRPSYSPSSSWRISHARA